jgi:hypothetical protein
LIQQVSVLNEVSDKSAEYRKYLDKEMTIMGILSAFSVSAVVIVLKGLGDAKSDSVLRAIWDQGAVFVVTGCLFALTAALFFYLERSILAWYYGQLCLAENGLTLYSVRDWLYDADSWATWNRYKFAFALLSLSFFEFSCSLIAAASNFTNKYLTFLHDRPQVCTVINLLPIVLPVCLISVLLAHTLLLNRLRYSDEPYRVVYRYLRAKASGLKLSHLR